MQPRSNDLYRLFLRNQRTQFRSIFRRRSTEAWTLTYPKAAGFEQIRLPLPPAQRAGNLQGCVEKRIMVPDIDQLVSRA